MVCCATDRQTEREREFTIYVQIMRKALMVTDKLADVRDGIGLVNDINKWKGGEREVKERQQESK